MFTRTKVRYLFLFLFPFFAFAGHADAASSLHGRITDSATGYGIEGALVALDADPVDGVHEYAVYTDIFGFYDLPEVDGGTYGLTASHPAYQDGGVDELELSDSARAEQSLALDPNNPTEPRFDIYVQVNCVVTGLALEEVPVSLTVVPDKPGIFGSQVTRSGNTDNNGFLHMRGLPVGQFSFTINQGDGAVPGWEGYQDGIPSYLSGPHTARVGLMPVLSSIDVQVYGYDPVTEEAGVLLEGIYVEATGVDPNRIDHELMPTRTGVSAITKENPEGTPTEKIWDNTRKGKVNFSGLPPIDWMIDCKRLGYEPKNRHIRTDVNAQFFYDNTDEKSIRFDMVMLDTRLSVAVDSDYRDRKMLGGTITVRIQGLKDTNTAGIEREGTVTYNQELDVAEVEFDNILPGTYRLTAAGTAERKIEIHEGNRESGEWIETKRFDIRFAAEAFVEALPDIDREIDVHLEPQPMTFRGQLVRVDEEAPSLYSSDYIHVPTPASGITFRVSDYMTEMIPEAHRVITVDSDDKGEFTVTLLPGLYGIVVPGMDEYWGEAVEIVPADGGTRGYDGWPYYQVWPFSAASARDNFHYNAGGMAVSSDRELRAMLFVRKDWINADCGFVIDDDPTALQVVGIDKSEGPAKYVRRYARFYDVLEDNPQLTLNGPSSRTLPVTTRNGQPSVRFEKVLPGSYTVTLTHPRFGITEEVSFDYFDFNSPGELPATAPPSYTMDNPHPMLPFDLEIPVSYQGCGSTTITLHQWVPEQIDPPVPGHYEVVDEDAMPSYIKMGYAGERIFNYGGKTPGSSYTVWLDLNSYFESGENHWYKLESGGGDLEADIYLPSPEGIGGSNPAQTATTAPLEIAYNLTIEARDVHDPEGPAITGASVPFNDGITRHSGQSYSGLTGPLDFDRQNIQHSNWSYGELDALTVNTASATAPAITITIYMKRGMAIRGTITNKETGSTIPEAGITVTKHHGGSAILGPPSGADGTFEYPFTWEGMQVYYIEVNAKGYRTFRKRLNPEDATQDPEDPRTKEHNLGIELVSLEGPTVADGDVSFDRCGSFLPSVSRAGNQSAFNGLKAEEQLTLTWNLAATRKQHTYTLAQFDDPEGNTREDITLDPWDDIAEVWLVDLRGFEKNTYDDEAQPLTSPAANEPHLVHAWLAKVSCGDDSTPNVFSQRVARFTAGTDENQVRAQGRVKLWKLPPDKFTPAFVVVSRMGAVTVYPFHEKDAYLDKELTGMRLPPWMGFLANVLGTVAGTQATISEVEKFMPEGRFKALPAFTADIELVDDHYVSYQYAVDVNLKEGMDGPAQGLVGLAPGIIGLDLTAKLEAGMNGQERKFHIAVEGGISRNEVNRDGFKPSFFRHLGVGVTLHPSPYGSVATKASQSLTSENMPNDFQITHTVSGTVGAKASVSILKILQKIPYVGPVLLLAEKARAINKADAYVRGLIGLTSTTNWRTVFPHQIEHYSVVSSEKRQLRRHFLGGNEKGENEPQEEGLKTAFTVCFGFGVGLEVDAIGNRVGASGEIALSGQNCGKTKEPALTIDPNPLGDWPPIRRISGDVRATLKAYLDAWVKKIEKEYVWTAIKIDIPMGEKDEAQAQAGRAPMALEFPKTTFELAEMEITVTEVSRSQYPPVQFNGDPPQVIRDFVPIGDFAASTGDEQMMLYSDMDTEGNILLKAASGDSGSWGEGVAIAQTAGAVVDTAVVASGDTWVAVWSEIPEEHVDDVYASSTIRYAVRNGSGQWSGVGTLASLENLGLELRLVPLGDDVALVFLETDEGPGADTFAVKGIVWDGTAWGEPVELLPYMDMTDFDAAGSKTPASQPAGIVYTDADGVLYAMDWDGTATVGAPYEPLSGASLSAEDVSLILGTDNCHYLAYSAEDKGIGLLTRAPEGQWMARDVLFSGIDPADLKVAFVEGATPVLLFAWTEGGGVSSIQYGFSKTDGTVFVQASALTRNTTGRYVDPALLPESGQKVTVTARFHNDSVEELRSFTVAYPDGPVPSDTDGDGMDDRFELLVVDADSQDEIQDISQVAPGDDFDEDGYPNAEEILAGTDPAWAADHPWYGDILRDGTVDLADALLGLQVLTRTHGAHSDSIADVDLDGRIGLQEVLYVLQVISSQ